MCSVSAYSAAGNIVLDGEPDAVEYMHEESQGKDGNHDVDYRSGHEVAAPLEQAVPCAEEDIIICGYAVFAGETVNHRKKVDGPVQKQEKDKECATDGLDEFLADGLVENEHLFSTFGLQI